jgi:hypothetical protein
MLNFFSFFFRNTTAKRKLQAQVREEMGKQFQPSTVGLPTAAAAASSPHKQSKIISAAGKNALNSV